MKQEKIEKTIFLIRHGEPLVVDLQKRYLGRLDPDLSPTGTRQAERLGQAFRYIPVQAIFTSDLLRAVNTGMVIAGERNYKPEKIRDFREINLGEWEGRTFQEIQERHPLEFKKRGQDIANYRTPGGESFADVQKRAFPAFIKIVERTEGNIIIVGHAGVNRVILCYLMQRPLREILSIPQDYAAVNIILENRGKFRVIAVNADAESLTSGSNVT